MKRDVSFQERSLKELEKALNEVLTNPNEKNIWDLVWAGRNVYRNGLSCTHEQVHQTIHEVLMSKQKL